MELFFDLVYVFAVTQLSHTLAEHLTARGALQTLVLFLAVWWAWNYTAWATNWVDPERTPVRLLLIALMLLSLVMSAAIPEAFEGRAKGFAITYVGLQVLRSAFMVWALRGRRMGRNYAQLLAWSAIAGVPWILGAFVDDPDTRLWIWILALVLDLAAPMHGFRLPFLGATPTRDWDLVGGHLAERCQLVVIIALGESILVTGQEFATLESSVTTIAAFAIAFLGSVALFGIYFAHHAEEGALTMGGEAVDATRLGRGGYAYAHAVMVAGIIVAAVGDERSIAHPTGHTSWATAAVVLGGPAIYLAGNALFRAALTGAAPVSRLGALALLGALFALVPVVSPLVLSALSTAVLMAVVAAEIAGRRRVTAGSAAA
jgi:low temperature requirement protein LtrA